VSAASGRLLRLLGLLQSRPDWPGAELAATLGVTARTLRRDVQKLRDLEYPVHSVPGVAGGYRLGRGGALPPLLLDDEEAVAVVLSLRSAASHAVTGSAEASVRALAKLDQVLPSRLRSRIAALKHATVALTGPVPTVDPSVLTMLGTACRERQRIRLRYVARDSAASERTIEPYRLVSAGYRWYLVAFDAGRQDWRTFRVDRICEPQVLGGRFAPRDAPDAAAFVAAAVTTAPYRYQAKVLVRAAAGALAERVSPTSGILQPAGPEACLLTTGADSLDAIVLHLASLGAEFTVLEPPELTERVRETAARMLRACDVREEPPGRSQGVHSDAVRAVP
jgi:predicted DNA-binding transcriptional regulator YafY